MPGPDHEELRDLVARLAAIERPSASDGERRAAELIAAELREAGARVRLEEERVHGTYWWPLGLLTGAAAAAGLTRGRLAGAVVGAFAAAAVADDVRHESRWFRRRFLPTRTTVNVTAEIGPEDAARTVALVAHHDAAHSGLVFHPELPRAVLRRFPSRMRERAKTSPGSLWGAFLGPLAVAIGSALGIRPLRRAGTAVSAGYAAAMADICLRGVVPGANDNLTGVAAIVCLARALRDEPVPGLRVLLVSTGSEESFSEGMQAWGRRHFGSLPRETTDFIALDTVGSPCLVPFEGEGMLGIHEYPKDLLALICGCARELGIETIDGIRFRNATDGVIPLMAGYRTAMIGSADEFRLPTNYHWPTDTPENVDYGTVADCVRLCEAVLRRLAPAARAAAEAPVAETA